MFNPLAVVAASAATCKSGNRFRQVTKPDCMTGSASIAKILMTRSASGDAAGTVIIVGSNGMLLFQSGYANEASALSCSN